MYRMLDQYKWKQRNCLVLIDVSAITELMLKSTVYHSIAFINMNPLSHYQFSSCVHFKINDILVAPTPYNILISIYRRFNYNNQLLSIKMIEINWTSESHQNHSQNLFKNIKINWSEVS